MEINHFISQKRFIFILGVMVVSSSLLIAKYAKQMLIAKPEEQPRALTQERGGIFDRNGKILAAATTLYNLSANKTLITDYTKLASLLSPIIEIPETTIIDKIRNINSNFFYL